jgi:hypothetical protein
MKELKTDWERLEPLSSEHFMITFTSKNAKIKIYKTTVFGLTVVSYGPETSSVALKEG